MQLIYQGSNIKISNPKIIKSKYTKDFGYGFYCTNILDQAKKWSLKYDNSVVNIYEYEENNDLKIKEFNEMTDEWLDFIVASRNGITHNYDIVIGAMADDQIYNYITDLINGSISREAFWELAKFKYPTHQIAFCTDKALECLKYLETIEVDE